jgi:hypothetical protein
MSRSSIQTALMHQSCPAQVMWRKDHVVMPKLGRQARLLNLKLDHKLISSFTLCLKEGPPKSADPRIVKNWVRV